MLILQFFRFYSKCILPPFLLYVINVNMQNVLVQVFIAFYFFFNEKLSYYLFLKLKKTYNFINHYYYNYNKVLY